jgi:molybdenum cofactor biosynthesis protein B
VAVLTVSDTRTPETDTGGQLIRQLLEEAGHVVAGAAIVSDDESAIAGQVSSWAAESAIDAVILTGGTGLAARDRSVEALAPLLDRTIDGFGELFRMLSYEEIGAAAMLSRAFAGVVGKTPVFALPGSRNAISLAMEKLILPELGHVVFEVKK